VQLGQVGDQLPRYGRVHVTTNRTGQPIYGGKPLVGFCVDQLPVVLDVPDDRALTDIATEAQASSWRARPRWRLSHRSTMRSGLIRSSADSLSRRSR
jgi:hypothetical protein